MSTRRQGQGLFTKHSSNVVVQPETWLYIKYAAQCSDHPKTAVKSSIKIIKFNMGSGMESLSTSTNALTEKFRWQSHEDIAILVALFGETCCYGIRKPRPSIKTQLPTALRCNDEINLIEGSDETCLNPLSRSVKTGIDSSYCPEDGILRFSFRFKRKVYYGAEAAEFPKRLKVLISRGDPRSADALVNVVEILQAPEDEDSLHLEIEDEFIVDGKTVEIIQVLDTGDAVVVFADDTTAIISEAVAKQQIRDYLHA